MRRSAANKQNVTPRGRDDAFSVLLYPVPKVHERGKIGDREKPVKSDFNSLPIASALIHALILSLDCVADV